MVESPRTARAWKGRTVEIAGAVALVTGANRGLGRAFARALVERKAAKVYGAARDPGSVVDAEVTPVVLDVTDAAQVARLGTELGDVTLLVNNAGVLKNVPLIAGPDLSAARQEMEVNYFGALAMCRAFAPVLGANGGGAIVNMHSIVSWFAPPAAGSYGASKAAEWAMTNAVRMEVSRQGTLVVGVHCGFIDTDMAEGVEAPKLSPEEVAGQALDAVEEGRVEVLADEMTRDMKASLPRDHELIYPRIQAAWEASLATE